MQMPELKSCVSGIRLDLFIKVFNTMMHLLDKQSIKTQYVSNIHIICRVKESDHNF